MTTVVVCPSCGTEIDTDGKYDEDMFDEEIECECCGYISSKYNFEFSSPDEECEEDDELAE